MRWGVLLFFSLVLSTNVNNASAQETCRYGLGTGSSETCSSREKEALHHVAADKSICLSAQSQIQWNKKTTKQPTWAWSSMRSGESRAIKDFTLVECDRADLVVKYVYDDMYGTVQIEVTDAESGNVVFRENRDVSDLQSDAVRMADHWRGMVSDARSAARAELNAALAAAREQAEQARQEEEIRKCQAEFDSLKQNIISYLQVQHLTTLPAPIIGQIQSHNEHCSNSISAEGVIQQQKAEEDAKLAQQRQETLRAEQAKRTATLERVRSSALVAFTNRLVSSPFMPPVDGWTRATGLPNASFYIILPGKGFDSGCHFAMDGERPALDCLGAGGRNDYFSVQNNDRWYLLKSKWSANGEYAGTVKDRGTTLCLRKAGCYHILAELRQAPTELPGKFTVPVPGALAPTYSNDDLSFAYPQNWSTEESKFKDNPRGQEVVVAPPEARLASWLTHGMIVGHVLQFSQTTKTIDGAFDHFSALQEQTTGLQISNAKPIQVGGLTGKIASYTAPSILNVGESGWLVVAKDRGEGYYWVMLFYPSNDDSRLYAQTLGSILNTVSFKK
jgi:hypothetical protein